MTHRQRIENALSGHAVDRPPLGFWRHFPNEDRAPRRLAELMMRLQRDVDLDFIKLMPYGLYSVVDWGVKLKVFEGFLDPPIQAHWPVTRPQDWARLRPLAGDSGEYAVVLEAQRILLSELSEPIPVVQTVFSPLTSALKMAGQETLLRHLNDNPSAVQAGLEIIAETTRLFALKAVSLGADGIFLASQMSRQPLLTPAQHAQFVHQYDLVVLNEIEDKTWFNILHLHGAEIMIKECLDYPIQAFNWHDRDEGPSLSAVRELTDKCLIGGVGHKGVLLKGAPEEVTAQVEDAWRQLRGRGLIIGPGCGDQTRIPVANLDQMKKSVMALAGRKTKN